MWEDKLREEALGGISAATIFYILAFVCSPTRNIHKRFKRPPESEFFNPFSKIRDILKVFREKGGGGEKVLSLFSLYQQFQIIIEDYYNLMTYLTLWTPLL